MSSPNLDQASEPPQFKSIEERAAWVRHKEQCLAQQAQYLREHPEVQQMLHDLVASCLTLKPDDVALHARAFFSQYTPDGGADLMTPLKPLTAVATPAPTAASPASLASAPRPLVVCGPSGVGKGTLLKLLLERHAALFAPVVSHTSRAPRPGEEHAVHYFFSTVDEMQRDIDAGLFIEHARVHQNLYGKSQAAVRHVQAQGKVCVLELDVQGAQTIKASPELNAHFLFVAPPSFELLEQRLRARGTESEEQLIVRTAGARHEMDFMQSNPDFFSTVIVNDDLETAYSQLCSTLGAWYSDAAFAALRA
jgi:guanylate kinase